MNTLALDAVVSQNEFMRLLNEDAWFEVINGEVIPVSPNRYFHHVVVSNIYDILKAYLRQNKLGRVLPDGMICVLRVNENGVRDSRIPDVCFIRKERLPKGFRRNDVFYGAPDLVVEVVSPGEGASDLRDKIVDYLSEGTEQVWVVYPNHQEVHVYTGKRGETVRIYRSDEQLEAESLFPDLKLTVAAFFADEFEEE